MFMHKSKKGFTIVELVIVIAVIAILAAVLIPTFSNLVKKANQSADIQAARQMNTVLAAEGAVEKNNIFEVYEALAANGMTAKDYKPLTTDHYFFWDDVADRIVYTDKNYQVLFPNDFEKDAKANWYSLNAKIPTREIKDFATKTEVVVKSAEEMAYVVEQFNSGKHTAASLTINLNGKTIDMMGASVCLQENGTVKKDITIIGGKDANGNVGTIKNVSAINPTHQGKGKQGDDGQYFASGLVGGLNVGVRVTIDTLVVENIHIKNTHTSGAGILVAAATNSSKVTIKDVTIKNSSVIAHRNVGALVGNAADFALDSASPEMADEGIVLQGNITLDNVQVKTVGGRSGLLIGYINAAYLTQSGNTITLQNGSAYDMYTCEQNTGSGLGLTGTTLTSKVIDSDNTEKTRTYQFFKGAYATSTGVTVKDDNSKGETEYNTFNVQ